jgi:hypothetical protein
MLGQLEISFPPIGTSGYILQLCVSVLRRATVRRAPMAVRRAGFAVQNGQGNYQLGDELIGRHGTERPIVGLDDAIYVDAMDLSIDGLRSQRQHVIAAR